MIYLFNSAFNLTYLENVYRLVGLPQGTRVDMRYTEDVNAPTVETDAKRNNSECIICYVDRFADQYVYYPCRKGRIRSIRREQSRVFYNIELGKHCHSSSPKEFTKEIQMEVEYSPRLTNGDPTCGEDGIYCVEGPDAGALVTADDASWSKVVDQIYETKAFSNSVPALFLVDIDRGGKKPKGSKGGLELEANTEYELTVHYRYPIGRSEGGRRRIQVKMGSEINRELSVGSVADRLMMPFNLPPLDFSAGAIIIETTAQSNDSTGDQIRYTATVPFRTRAWRLNLLLFGSLFLISFLDEFRKVGWSLTNADAWLSTFLEFLKFAIVLWAVFKYRGKLKLPGL